MKYESSIYGSSWVIDEVKVIVHAYDHANANAGVYDNSFPDIRPGELKIKDKLQFKFLN